jgi:hypothetical protein
MPYRIKARYTGDQLALEAQDWWNLLELARQRGWKPEGDRKMHEYLYNPSIVPSTVAKEIAEALEGVVDDLPQEEKPQETNKSDAGPDKDPLPYFGGEHSRRMLEKFMGICRRGELSVQRTPPT